MILILNVFFYIFFIHVTFVRYYKNTVFQKLYFSSDILCVGPKNIFTEKKLVYWFIGCLYFISKMKSSDLVLIRRNVWACMKDIVDFMDNCVLRGLEIKEKNSVSVIIVVLLLRKHCTNQTFSFLILSLGRF